MQVSIANDGRFSSGHAFITVQDCPPPGDSPWFYLRRASDRMYLSASAHWLNTLERIPVCGGLYRDGTYYIPIGPEILSELDSLENHVFSLNGQDPVPLEIPPVLPTGLFPDTTGAVGAVSTPKATRLQPEPAPQPAPEPQPEPAPQPEPEPQPEPVAQAAPLSMGATEAPKSGPGKGVIIAIVVVALLALGAALYFFVLRDKGEEEATQPPAASEQAKTEPEAKPEQAKPEQTEQATPQKPAQPEQGASQAPQAAPTPFLSTARQHLQGNADPAQSLALAKPMRTMNADANTSDGAFLLIEDAAEKGNAEAMFLLAQYYDPTSTLPRGSIQTDVSQAVQWYRQAAQNGIAEADAALKALKASLEQKAAAGDAEAKRLLQNF